MKLGLAEQKGLCELQPTPCTQLQCAQDSLASALSFLWNTPPHRCFGAVGDFSGNAPSPFGGDWVVPFSSVSGSPLWYSPGQHPGPTRQS